WHETRISHPSLDVKLFRDPRLSSAVAALGLVFFGMMGAIFFLSFYLQGVRGYTPLSAGLLTLPFAAGQLLVAPRTARLVSRFGAKAVAAAGLLTAALALAGYQLLGTATPIWVLGVTFFLQGAGMGLVMPPATESVMSVVPRERAGSGSALTNTARQVAGALGVAVLGSILAQAYRGQLSPHLAALPHAAANTATGSITATQTIASRLGGAAGARLDGFADVAFVHAMHLTTVISAAVTVAGALVVLAWMPGRRARQAEGTAPGQAGAPAPAAAEVPAARRASTSVAAADGEG
ncbi:MAG: MFS transporter, partial [Actinobacteria bacterium]|nr:MFS transporter [Actinomycetota bacterium]